MDCIYVDGDLDSIKNLLENYIGNRYRRYKLGVYGRIYVYKIGFRRKIVLIYYYSDGKAEICASSKDLYELRSVFKNYSVSEFKKIVVAPKTRSVEDMVIEKIMERNKVKAKMIESKRRLVFFSIMFLALYIIIWIMSIANISMIFLLAILYILSISVPHTLWHFMYPERLWFIPILYIRYKRKYEELSREIREYLVLIPSSSNARKVLEEIIARD